MNRLVLVLLPAILVSLPITGAAQDSIIPTSVTDQNRTGPLPFSTTVGGAIDQIDVSGGNLSIRIPLFHLKSRGQDFTVILRWEGNFYSPATFSGNGVNEIWTTQKRPYFHGALGWQVNEPYVTYSRINEHIKCLVDTLPPVQGPASDGLLNAAYNFIYTDENGGPHTMDVQAGYASCPSIGSLSFLSPGPDTGGQGFWLGPASNTDDAFVKLTTAPILDPSGMAHEVGDSTAGTSLSTLTQIFSMMPTSSDVNGNQQTQMIGGSDTLGRTPITEALNGNTDTLSYTDANGNPQSIQITFATVPVATVFDQSDIYGGQIYEIQGSEASVPVTVISSITLANGTSYTFTYGTNGYISSMKLPTGAQINYQTSYLLDRDFSRIYYSSRTENVSSPNIASQSNTTNIQLTCSGNNGCNGSLLSSVIGADQKLTQFLSSGSNIVQATYYDGASISAPIRKTEVISYGTLGVGSLPVSSWVAAEQMLPTSISETLDGMTSRTEYDYDSFLYMEFNLDMGFCSTSLIDCVEGGDTPAATLGSRGDVTAIRQYDWGSGGTWGPLIKQTIKTYLQDINPNYFFGSSTSANPANVVDRVSTDSVYDGSAVCYGGQSCSANLLAQTSYGYDEDGAGYLGRVTSIQKWVNLPAPHTDTSLYHYDSYGNITSIRDAMKNTTSWTYADAWNAPHGACLPSANTSAFPTAMIDPLGHATQASYYPCTGQTASIKDANDLASGRNGHTFAYDLMNRLEAKTMPDGGFITNIYNDAANTVDTKQGQSQGGTIETLIQNDSLGRPAQSALVSDPAGAVFTNTSYDSMGRVSCVSNQFRGTLSGNQTCKTYDLLGRPTVVTEADNSTIQYGYSGNEVVTTDEVSNSWIRMTDALGRLTQVFEPGLLETDYSYDALSNLLGVRQKGKSTESPRLRSFTYDSLSRLLTACNPEALSAGATCTAGSAGPWSTTYSYDANGNDISKTSGLGTVSYCYDSLNRLTSKGYSGQTCPMSNPDVSYIYDASGVSSATNTIGRLTSESSYSGGNVVSTRTPYRYDAMGRLQGLQECVFPNCGSAPYEIDYTYDLAGEMLTSTNGLPAPTPSVPSPNYVQLTMGYDSASRLSSITSSWSDATTHPPTLFQANSGSPSAPAYSPAGGLMNALLGVNPLSNNTTVARSRSYDNRLRVISENDTTSGMQTTPATTASGSILIAGLEQQSTGPATYGTGSISVTGTELGHSVCTTRYQYGPNGRIIPITTCVTVSDTGSLAVTVNAATVFTATATYQSGSTDATVASALATALNGTGSPVSASVGTITTGSGANTNVIYITSLLSGTAGNYPYSITNGVDFGGTDSGATLTGGAAGGPVSDTGTISVSVNGGTTVTAPWQSGSSPGSLASSLAAAFALPANGYTTLFTATPTSNGLNLTSLQSGSAGNLAISCSETDTSSQFSAPSFTTSCAGMLGGANAQSGPATVYSYSIPSPGSGLTSGYAANGNLLSVTDSVTGAWNYSYDNLNRLTQAVGVAGSYATTVPVAGVTLGWSYDSFGNRLGQTSTSGNFPTTWQCYWPTSNVNCTNPFGNAGANNQMTLSSAAPAGISYDNAGDVINDGNNSFIYDMDGKVCAVTSLLSGTTQYVYDAEGQRIAKMTNGAASCTVSASFSPTTTFLRGGGGELVTELGAGGRWNYTNIYAGGSLLATYRGTNTYFALNDWLGTKRVEVTPDGQISTYATLPFGDFLSPTGNAVDATENHFTGKERDAESGLDYFGARYYASGMGRFMSPDWSAKEDPVPYANLGNPQSLNLYVYAGNNPLSRLDPDGHDLVQLGQHTDQQIKDQIAADKAGLKDKSLDPDIRQALNSNIKDLQAEKEGNAVVGALLSKLDQTGQRNGLKLSDFTLSTDTKNDFAGLATPGAIAKMMGDQAFVPQAGQFKGTIFIRTEPEDGFYQMSRSSSDYGYFGATAIGHEQVHKNGGGEFPAYQRQLDLLHGFHNSIQNPGLYQRWQDFIQGGINANQPH